MKVNFVVRKSVVDKHGLSPIFMSLSIDGVRKYVSTGKKVNARHRMPDCVSDFLEALRRKCQDVEVGLMKRGVAVNMSNFMSAYVQGFKTHTIGQVYDECIALKQEKAAAGLISDVQVRKYSVGKRYFIDAVGDLDVGCVTPNVVDRYATHLMSHMANNSAMNYMKILKSVLSFAVDERYIMSSPFRYAVRVEKSDVVALTEDELKTIMNKNIYNDRLSKVRDCFLVQCLTALSYIDMASLSKDDLREGGTMIIKARGKTGVMSYVPLVPEAITLLEKYGYKMPVLSNQKYNSYLKELGDICGISKRLHSHLARHTAGTIMLNRGVPLEVVSRVLGHSNTKITASVYAKLLPETIKSAVLSRMVPDTTSTSRT